VKLPGTGEGVVLQAGPLIDQVSPTRPKLSGTSGDGPTIRSCQWVVATTNSPRSGWAVLTGVHAAICGGAVRRLAVLARW
jgi:hypothetical protein